MLWATGPSTSCKYFGSNWQLPFLIYFMITPCKLCGRAGIWTCYLRICSQKCNWLCYGTQHDTKIYWALKLWSPAWYEDLLSTQAMQPSMILRSTEHQKLWSLAWYQDLLSTCLISVLSIWWWLFHLFILKYSYWQWTSKKTCYHINNINIALCKGNLKILLVCCVPTYPPKSALSKKFFSHSREFFFFILKPTTQIYIHYNLFILNFIFSCRQCFETLYLYGQHFGPYTIALL